MVLEEVFAGAALAARIMGYINDVVGFGQSVRSAASSIRNRWGGTTQQRQDSTPGQLQRDIQRQDSTPGQLRRYIRCLEVKMKSLINYAEAAAFEKPDCQVSLFVSELKDAVHDAEDCLDEYETCRRFDRFFLSHPRGCTLHNEVNEAQNNSDNMHGQMMSHVLQSLLKQHDKPARPETNPLCDGLKIFGREKEIKTLLELLGIPNDSTVGAKRRRDAGLTTSSTRKRGRSAAGASSSNEATAKRLAVLPIVGGGGVGKTSLVQEMCGDPTVQAYFDLIIRPHVSEEFDVKWLTKEIIQYAGLEVSTDDLNSLQVILKNTVRSKRIMLVLDNICEDVSKESGQMWQKFCAPLKRVLEGSIVLVTTRSQHIADMVRTMEPFRLDGLQDDALWELFKVCVFGHNASNSDSEFDRIARSMVPKLKGSPLAAKVLGRALRLDPDIRSWRNISESKIWEQKHQESDISPALKLSYLQLPFHLKRCFSLCAIYPKGYRFDRDTLVDIWAAENFHEPQAEMSIADMVHGDFEEFISRSLLQKAPGLSQYVIHDSLHDLALLVSKDECFMIKDRNDLLKAPKNVRHISIFTRDKSLDADSLALLSRYKKLRTIICNKDFGSKTSTLIDHWCTELTFVRVLSFTNSKLAT